MRLNKIPMLSLRLLRYWTTQHDSASGFELCFHLSVYDRDLVLLTIRRYSHSATNNALLFSFRRERRICICPTRPCRSLCGSPDGSLTPMLGDHRRSRASVPGS